MRSRSATPSRLGHGGQLGGVAARRPWSDADQHAAHVRAGAGAPARRSAPPAPSSASAGPGSSDDPMAVRQPPCLGQPRDPLARSPRRVEHQWVHAARDHPDARRIGRRCRAMISPAMKWLIAITRSPLRHHRVVAALERQVLAVGAVIGGDEMRPGAPRGQPTPTRPARATGRARCPRHSADQGGEAAGVAPDGQRVLGISGRVMCRPPACVTAETSRPPALATSAVPPAAAMAWVISMVPRSPRR